MSTARNPFFARVPATRLYDMPGNAGMKDVPSFLIARCINSNGWRSSRGLEKRFAVLNSVPQKEKAGAFSYVVLGIMKDGRPPPQRRFTGGPSLDGRGAFSSRSRTGQEPPWARSDSGAQVEQMQTVKPIRP